MTDKEMREPLFDYLDLTFGKNRVIEEKIIQGSRADVVAVLEGHLAGIEIKSDRDTYTRLSSQVPDYDKNFDYCYLAVGASHEKHAAEHVPDHWGILVIREDGVEEIRPATPSPKLDRKKQLRILWKRELYHILDTHGFPKYRGKSAAFIIEYLIDRLPPEELMRAVTEELFERDYTIFEDAPKVQVKIRKTKAGVKVKRKTAPTLTKHTIGRKSRKRKH